MHYQLAIFGNPVKHSLSPIIHQLFAKQFALDLTYNKRLVPKQLFVESLQNFQNEGGFGANITVPFKEEAFLACYKTSKRAQAAKSVNTLLQIENKQWYGDNTDGYGLVRDLLSNNIPINSSRILIIGAGGAARGVIQPILDCSPTSLTITNRTYSKAEHLAKTYHTNSIPFEDLHRHSFDLIINATSSGLLQENLNLSEKIFNNCNFAYDMVYSKKDTPFMNLAKKNQIPNVLNGLGMLVYQAAESFKVWTNLNPDCKTVLNYLRKNYF